ncbi:MAG TPA: GGDEF domain-containing protein [Burkholderiaceae bacterium]|nr:GGDEF domain-containing protein [Burkholderiaceae bacterium]
MQDPATPSSFRAPTALRLAITALERTSTLANRQALVDRAPGILMNAQRHGHQVRLPFIDFDGFKSINDGLGHSSGDMVLRSVATRMSSALCEQDLLVRLGSEVVVVVAGVIAAKRMETVREPVYLGARTVRLTASIGLAVSP